MTDINKLIGELNSDDWKEIFIAVRMHMVKAIEHPSQVNKSDDYYEDLALKVERIRTYIYKKEKGWD